MADNDTAWMCPRCKHFEQHPAVVTTAAHRCPNAAGKRVDLTPFTREAYDALELAAP